MLGGGAFEVGSSQSGRIRLNLPKVAILGQPFGQPIGCWGCDSGDCRWPSIHFLCADCGAGGRRNSNGLFAAALSTARGVGGLRLWGRVVEFFELWEGLFAVLEDVCFDTIWFLHFYRSAMILMA